MAPLAEKKGKAAAFRKLAEMLCPVGLAGHHWMAQMLFFRIKGKKKKNRSCAPQDCKKKQKNIDRKPIYDSRASFWLFDDVKPLTRSYEMTQGVHVRVLPAQPEVFEK